ncbi:amidohydrolase family protein [Acidobacteria bacterium AH-259-D05]|nr:amidohydrolase family protein [Acidobacteria bacterium AH-259-D05]
MMKFLSSSLSAGVIRFIWCITICTPWLVGQEQEADIVLHNGKILTVNGSFSTAEAVAISGRQFRAVGQNQDVLRLAGPSTVVIDLKGRTVLPGLIDTHGHIHNYAERAYGGDLGPLEWRTYPIDWRGVRNKDDVLNQIKGWMDKYQFQPGEWIYFTHQGLRTREEGRGPNDPATIQVKILYDELTRWELDKVTPNNPVALSLGIPHFNGFLVNEKAMQILWGKYGDFIERYGRYWVDSSRRPDGHLEPPASRLVFQYLPRPSPEVVAPVYKSYLDELAASGVTSVSSRLPSYSLEAYQLLEARGELTLRMSYGREWDFGNITDLQNDMNVLKGMVGRGTDKIWVTSIAPTAVDGSGTRACTDQKKLSTYSVLDNWWPVGQCHNDIEYRGAPRRSAPIQGNYYREWTFASAREGIRYANTHVAGDRGVELLLNIVDQIQRQMGPSATKGWAMDHCFMVDPADFARAARLGITFSCAPKYIEGAPLMAKSYGEKVAHTFLVPVKSMLDAGVKVVFEVDRDMYIWYDLELLMTRMGGDGNVWGPQERVDRTTALKMITRWAADYVLKGDKLGSIEPGKLADLVVLDRDYMTIPAQEISEIRPQITVLNGKIIYVHPQFAEEYNLKSSSAIVATYEELQARRTSSSQ